MNNSGFGKFISEILKNKSIKEVLLDLTECTYLDSTNLGLVAAVSIGITAKGYEKPVLLISTNEMKEALCNVGFEKIFFLVEKEKSNLENLSYIISHTASKTEKKDEILEAHRTLLEMNDKNRETFADVVKYLENE